MKELRNSVIDYYYSLAEKYEVHADGIYTEIYFCKTCTDEEFELYVKHHKLKELLNDRN